jgi:ComEC/Rec2-related protein
MRFSTTLIADFLSPLLRRPLVCLLLCWMAGIMLGTQLRGIPWETWGVVAGILLLCWGILPAEEHFSRPLALGFAALCLAAGMTTWRYAPLTAADSRFLPAGVNTLAGYALETPTVTAFGWHTFFHLVARKDDGRWSPVEGDVYLSGRATPPHPGLYYELLGNVHPVDDAGNPFGFSWRDYLLEHDLNYHLSCQKLIPRTFSAPTSALGAARAYCSARLRATMPGAYGPLHAQILEALILGVHGSPLPEQISDGFKFAGIVHLVIVSGNQVTLLGLFFIFPLYLLPMGRARTSYPRLRGWLLGCSLPALFFYVALADTGPSMMRALLMALLLILSLFFALSPLARQRSFRPDRLTLLAAAGLVMLIGQPIWLYNAGWQITFAAVFGLITIMPIFLRLWERWSIWIKLPLATTVAAQLATFPVLAWYIGFITLLAPLTNLLASPVILLLLPLGLLTLIFSIIAPPLAMGINYLNLPLIKWLLATCALAERFPALRIQWYTHSHWLVLAYVLVLAIGLRHLLKWLEQRTIGWEVPEGREPLMW